MPVPADPNEDDWSDSDDEVEDDRSDVETSVLLGIPDVAIEKQEDKNDAAVSRIGGHPAFLSSAEPPFSSSQCKNCSFPMQLLVQLWCPFEESTMDRALYVFGCARGECQRKPGSVRTFRGLRFNAKYAAKLEKKRAHQLEKDAVREKAKKDAKQKVAAKVNPFSMNAASAPSGGLFGQATFGSGLGSQLFGISQPKTFEPEAEIDNDDNDQGEAPPPPESESEEEESEPGPDSDSESASEDSILEAPALAPSSSSPWSASPSYSPPLYLNTASEYVPPAPKASKPSISGAYEELEKEGKSKKGEARKAEKEKEDRAAWEAAMEGYEDSLEVDKVFEKFARVAGYEGEQCIRYELGGIPLPFAHDNLFITLFPSPSCSPSSISTSTKFTPATTTPARRTYDPKASVISPCPRCGGPRTFECQLMPHLISILQNRNDNDTSPLPMDNEPKGSTHPETERAPGPADVEARKKEVEHLLRGDKKRGMEWGTCMVFSCAKDCCLEALGEKKAMKEARELWAEELVLIQWDE